MSLSKYKGFTLIELLIVLVLIGLTTSFVLPNMWQQFDQAKFYSEKKQLASIITFSKEYSVYKGGSLTLVVSEEFLEVYEEAKPLKKIDDEQLSDSNIIDTEPTVESSDNSDEVNEPETKGHLVKRIDFKTFTLTPKTFVLDATNYFKKISLVITSKGTSKSEKIEA
jgi:prepilin-type N-terminal cleavage/methylation domain-containing protein